MTKKEYEQILGHNIRMDTYLICEGIKNGQSYNEIYDSINNNRELYNIKKDTILTKEATALKYIGQVYGDTPQKQVQIKQDSGSGIYGIYCDDELIYIGKTSNFHKRFMQHQYNITHKTNEYLYNLINRRMSDFDANIRFVPLVVIEKMNTTLKISERDLSMMELALITLYQPQGNIAGRLQPYSRI